MSADERRPVFRICALRLQYVSHGQYPASVSRALKQIFDTGYQSDTGYSGTIGPDCRGEYLPIAAEIIPNFIDVNRQTLVLFRAISSSAEWA